MIQEKLVEEIIQAMKNITKEFTQGDSKSVTWTKIIKDKFIELGKDKYEVFPNPDKGNGQWLYDLCWRKSSSHKKHNYLEELILILESEWQDRKDVTYDFQKLLQSKAKFKIMVFEKQIKRDDDNDLLREMHSNIKDFWNRDDEIYFLFQYDMYYKPLIIFPIYAKANRSFEIIMKTRELAESKEANKKYPVQNVSGEKGFLDFGDECIVTCNNGDVHKYKDIDYLIADGWVVAE